MSNFSNEEGFFGIKTDALLLLGGLVFLLINVVAFVGIDTRLSVWLFSLDIRYWSIYFSIVLWIGAIWVALESTDIVEDYLLIVRALAALSALIVVLLGLRSFFSGAGVGSQAAPLWLYVVYAVAICCAVRSLYLLYSYWNDGEEYIDFEEARWFWGVSGFLLAVLLLVGIAHIIPVKITPYHADTAPQATTLYRVCYDGMQLLIRNGHGSVGIRTLAFLIVPVFISFVYVVCKWGLIFLSKMRGE